MNFVNKKILVLLSFLVVATYREIQCYQVARLNVSEFTTLTLIYGNHNNSKMNFTDAENFCRNLKNNFTITGSQRIISHLISFHRAEIIPEVMKFTLSHENERFYIGATVVKVVHDDHIGFFLRWTDKTRDDFRFMHEPQPALTEMEPYEKRCVSVDYKSGRWGIHKCSKKMNVLCLTHIVDPEAIRDERFPQPPPELLGNH